MGQVLLPDKIGQLSEAGGTITLAPSRLTIGGQQYDTSALNVAADVGLANTRYQIFAVRNAGNTELVISQNENSVGPAGFNAWKLVGSYYTNGLSSVGFGAFLNIKGSPKTVENPIDYELDITDANEVSVVSGSPVTKFGSWVRDGEFVEIRFSYYHTTTPGSTGAAGAYHIYGPGFLSRDIAPGASNTGHPYGDFYGDVGGGSPSIFNTVPVVGTPYFRGRNRIGDGQTSVVSFAPGTTYQMSNNFVGVTGSCRFPVQGWTSTPIEDL